MKRYFLYLIILPLTLFSQSTNDSMPVHEGKKYRVKYPVDNINIGLFNNETGYSIVSYTRNILRNSDYRRHNFIYFISCGTNIIQNSIAIGIKKPIFDSELSKVLYSSIGIRGVYSIGNWDDFIAPSIAIGLDIPLSNHPNYQSRYSSKIGEVVGQVSPGIKQKEFINIGVSSIIRLNKNRINAIIIPNLNLSYRW